MANTTDSPGDTPNPTRAAEAKAFHDKIDRRKKSAAAVDKDKVSFVANGKKVVKKTTKPNGSVYTVYVGTTAECDIQKINYIK